MSEYKQAHANTLVAAEKAIQSAELESVDNRAQLNYIKHKARNRLWRLKQWMHMGMWTDERDNRWIKDTALIQAVDDRLIELKRKEQ